MTFVLRILISGLVGIVPSADGKEATVVLVGVDHAYHLSDGSALAAHRPMLLARGQSCDGDCPTEDAEVAKHLFAEKTSLQASQALAAAVEGGGVWQLAGVDLSVRATNAAHPLPPLVLHDGARASAGAAKSAPAHANDREDLSWLADLDQLYPQGGGIRPEVLGSHPPADLVAARLRLGGGRVYTYRVASVGGKAAPIAFQRLDGEGTASSYQQAVATWVAVDIAIDGDSVELVEDAFGGGRRRSMTLRPQGGVVEVALLNLPQLGGPPAGGTGAPQVGKHFERLYDLLRTPPAKQLRPVPQLPEGSKADAPGRSDWDEIHPAESELLQGIRLGRSDGRGPYDRIICPIGGFGPPPI
ncbi:MAG TPA: hypothetical protein VFS60_00910 [Thermoanaerobaculia bacterium]|nr:hypothetical protein [Thermoanaerobaculia bacterium]